MRTLRWALRESKNNFRFSLFFVLNMSIGLIGFLCLDALKTSIADSSLESSKAVLSADVAVSVRRQLTDQEIQTASEAADLNQVTMGRTHEFFSMVASPKGSRLVQVKAIDETYPFYGKLRLDGNRIVQTGDARDIQSGLNVWVYPEVLAQLRTTVGESLKLGDQSFKITGVVEDDGSQTLRLASLAPRVFVGMAQVKKSGLITFGTTMTDSLLFKTPGEPSVLMGRLSQAIKEPSIRIESFESAADDTGRPLKYLTDYLGLVSLVALFLAALGSAYLFRSYIFSCYYQIAIFNSLGLAKKEAQKIYLTQIVILALVSSVISLLGASALLPAFTQMLQSLTAMELTLTLPVKTLVLAVVMALVGSWIVSWPFLKPTERILTSQLLQEKSSIQNGANFRVHDLWYFVPGVALYWALAIWQAKSWMVGSLFVGLFFFALMVIWALGWAVLWSSGKIKVPFKWIGRQAFFSLGRRRGASLAAMIALGLGTLLMNLLPQLEASLQQDLSAPKNLKLPALFLFDIQDEQVDPLKSYVSSQNLQLQQLSPLVRARILKVNDQVYERQQQNEFGTREEEQQVRFRNRGVNLSYREGLSESETLEEGKVFTGPFDPNSGKPAELSVEQRFADRIGIQLNDTILFDVQGIEILGQVVNLRSVKWNSFQPNFFVQMQPGVLEEAPKTFLASIAGATPEQVAKLQDDLVEKFPNVSMVDVARVIQKVFEISDKMSWSLKLMAALSLIAGFVVLFSIANYEVRRRIWELNLIKILGGNRKQLISLLAIEFGFIGFTAACFGVLMSYSVSFTIARVIFDGAYLIEWQVPLMTIGLVTLTSLAIVTVVGWNTVRQRPADLLQG